MILASSDEGDVVLDPFLGSGTLLREMVWKSKAQCLQDP